MPDVPPDRTPDPRHEDLSRLFELSRDPLCISRFDGYIQRLNPACAEITGYSEAELLGRPFMELIHPDDHQATLVELAKMAGGAPSICFEHRIVRKDGEARWLEWTAEPKPETGVFYAVGRDVTRQRQATAALGESERRFRCAFDHAAIGMALVATTGKWITVNRALCKITGYTEVELLAATFQDITHPEDLSADIGLVQQVLDGRLSHYDLEKRYIHKAGHIVNALLSVALVRDDAGRPLHFVSQIQDITARKRAEGELRQAALYDPLTGLANRTLLLDRLAQAVARREREPDRHFALLYVDINDFKPINDRLGHAVGDQVLQQVSVRLMMQVRETDTLSRNDPAALPARVGGDEFVVLLDTLDQARPPASIARRIDLALREPLQIDGHTIHLTASIGMAAWDETCRSPDDLLRLADLSMYRDKRRHRAEQPAA